MLVPLIQTWVLSSPDTQIEAEFGVQAAHASNPFPIAHIANSNRKKRTPFGTLGARVATRVLGFSGDIAFLSKLLLLYS